MRMKKGIHFWYCSMIILATLIGLMGFPFPGIGPSNAEAQCTLTCPANITASNDPNQCGAVVAYPAPTTLGQCGTVTCSPASGSFFPKGTTTETCTASAGPSCTFTITVNDTQPPTIVCPANITTTNDQGKNGAVVNFSATASDNCPGVTTLANPPSGSLFPVATTTVTDTATDASGNTATCSFTVTVNFPRPTVPTFSEWGIVIMSVLLLGGAIYFIKRRKTI